MIVLENKFLSVLVNILLAIWQLPQLIIGLIGLAIFRNFEVYYNPEAGIKVIKVSKGYLFGNACFSLGPVIFTTPNCDDNTIRHETGHSKQSVYMGPLFFIVVAMPSIVLFLIRRIKNKDAKWYHSHWPEGGCKFGAEELGHTKR